VELQEASAKATQAIADIEAIAADPELSIAQRLAVLRRIVQAALKADLSVGNPFRPLIADRRENDLMQRMRALRDDMREVCRG
jgi:hypothetical protein